MNSLLRKREGSELPYIGNRMSTLLTHDSCTQEIVIRHRLMSCRFSFGGRSDAGPCPGAIIIIIIVAPVAC